MQAEKSRNLASNFGFKEKLAATYSRRTYRTTTIGKTVFDGRVRNGIGSDHSFMATKNRWSVKSVESVEAWSVKTDRNPISFDTLFAVKMSNAIKEQRSLKTAHRRI